MLTALEYAETVAYRHRHLSNAIEQDDQANHVYRKMCTEKQMS